MTILLTGGGGFIGSHFVMDYLPQTAIVNVDNLSYAANTQLLSLAQAQPNYHFIHGDINDECLLEQTFRHYPITTVVHMAAQTHVDRSIEQPDPFTHSNVLGTIALLKQATAYYQGLDSQAQKKFRFLYVSTDEVYGSLRQEAAPFTERDPVHARNPYSASKAAAEQFVLAWNNTYGLPVIISRCSNNYGPFQYAEKLIPKLFQQAVAERELPLYGDGQQVRDWIYVKDHCAALWFLLKHGQISEIYNIGACHEMRNQQIAFVICDFLQKHQIRKKGTYRDLISYVAERPGHDQRYAVHTQKLAALGWRPRYSFAQGMQATLAAYWQDYQAGLQ